MLLPLVGACELNGVTLTGADTDGGTVSTTGDGPGNSSATTTTAPTSTTDPSAGSDSEPTTEASTGEVPSVSAVDILFVIDNSGNMARHQERLVESIPALLAGLDGQDLRIAVTTTDTGNPRCPAAQTTPEGGKFVMRRCVDAIDQGDFIFDEEDFSSACTDHCTLSAIDFTVAPTSTALDPAPKPRNWIERTGGDLNVGTSLADALACALPQGVSGCGFESPLQAMSFALTLALTSDSQTNYGFLRPEADLRIIIVTDEADCSYRHEFKDIFTTNKTFWENPDRPDATSAVCFNAGVKCDGPGPTYASCEAVDFAADGTVAADPAQAVLRPISEYVELLQDIQATKTGGASVGLFALAGVPHGFETGTVPLVYADDPDPDQQELFGIAAGCVAADDANITAIPPTRLIGLATSMLGAPQIFSICDEDFDAAMTAAGSTP
ncbi:hypothetical protein [Nannocystis bainbridge]|uniref:VWFA domain-containing protein n=1 Tax=Nannocystis bainbridge TaxID=2995303 RepID=A0ABT5DUG5_9BACT|nr:hypothetical protein [Nannocystis bainbridge]MDC0717201.1 hypothetical protein [Nannocystis bainbridge]